MLTAVHDRNVFLLQNALLVTTAVEPFSALHGQANAELNYSLVYFWWTLSLIINLMALYSSVLMLATVLAVPKDHACIHSFVNQCTDGWIQTLAVPAFFTLLGAVVGVIAIFLSSWYAPRKWTFWLLLGLTCFFVAILSTAFRKADKARRDALKQK